jgi:alpha-L-fucosidase
MVEGTTIGYKVIRKFPVIRTSRIKVTVRKAKACPLISNIELYRAPGD